MWLKFHFHYELNHPLDFIKHLNGRFIYSKVNCWNRLKYISCSLWIRIFLFNLMWTFNSNDSSEIEIERKNSMMNKLSFHWNWYFICKKIIFSTGRKEDFNQNWCFRFMSLIIHWNSSIWKNQSNETMKFINWKTQFNINKLSFKTIKLKRINCFQLSLFILKLLFSSFLSIWNKIYDEIHWIDYFWIILVKKRIFCFTFHIFL